MIRELAKLAAAGALAVGLAGSVFAADTPSTAKNPCAAKMPAKNPCAAKTPAKNPCAAQNPCAMKNPCAVKK